MKKIYLALLLFFVFVLIATFPVLAAPAHQVPTDAPSAITTAGAIFAALVNIPGFITLLINLLKQVKVLPDTYAPAANFWLNIMVYLGIFVTVLLGKTDVITPIENAFSGINKVLVDIVVLLGGSAVSMGLSGFYHELLKKSNVPFFGYSHPSPNSKTVVPKH